MSKQYYGIGQVVYGKYKGFGVFSNDRNTYLVIGFLAGNANEDPYIEEVISQDTVQECKLISQIEANADSSAVLGATFWLGIGAGLLASQMGKHMEYTVELTFRTGEKSQLVLVGDGYSILSGSISIGAPEIQAAQAMLSRLKQKRSSIFDSLSAQISSLQNSLTNLNDIPNSDVAQMLSREIKDRIDILKEKQSELSYASETSLRTISDYALTAKCDESPANLSFQADTLLSAYRQYSEEYRDSLSQLNQVRREKASVEAEIESIKERRGKNDVKGIKRTLFLLIVAIGYTAFMIWCWRDESGYKYGYSLKPETMTIIATIIGVLFSIVFLSLLVYHVSSFVKARKNSSIESKKRLNELNADLKVKNSQFMTSQDSFPQFDDWYRDGRYTV